MVRTPALGRLTSTCQRFQPNVARGAASSRSPCASWSTIFEISVGLNHESRIAPNSTELGARILLASAAIRRCTDGKRQQPRKGRG